MKNQFLLSIIIFIAGGLTAQDIRVNPVLMTGPWTSNWITCPDVPQKDYGVYHFRKDITLATKPSRFIVHVSADNRYRLFINGKPVCNGPARGDLYNWYYETIDLAPYLITGKNILAALVWNMGEHAPVAQVTNRTAFLMQGDGDAERSVNTDGTWQVTINKAYQPCSIDNGSRLKTYMVIGPGDEVDASLYPWGWETSGYNNSSWVPARSIGSPAPEGYGTDNNWTLKPRSIPFMEENLQRMASVRRAENITVSNQFLSGKAKLVVPANKTISILIDQSTNTVAYPEMLVSSGKGAVIKVTYAEALFNNGVKGNRDSIREKSIIGNFDIFKPDGGAKRLFRPLWLRTYRYIQLDITTKAQALEILDFYGMYTGYPFKAVAYFKSNDSSLQQIWDVGWRTARLCAGENYYDCPYYEQLQYEGDTRIQALISLYVTGDDRLVRKALLDFYHSRVPEGLTQGRYPSNRLQVIPPFSLYWVSMVYDYWMHRKDDAFIRDFIQPVRGVLDWYEQKIDSSMGMLGPMKWWNFTDWNPAFEMGVPDGATDGNSSIITLQYAATLNQAAELFEYFGKSSEAAHYKSLAAKLAAKTYSNCFNRSSMLMANTPKQNSYSQHAGIIGVLSGAVPASESKQVMKKLLTDTSISQATFYYRFYLAMALKKAGMADLYYDQLAPWRGMLANGLTTFAENPDPTRSDCHAWSASPCYDFLATVCGIMPAAPGFEKVFIKPAFGGLKHIKGTMPHPQGQISIDLQLSGKTAISGEIVLPEGLTGEFVWNNKTTVLTGGRQKIEQ